jgi:hypothetical protein
MKAGRRRIPAALATAAGVLLVVAGVAYATIPASSGAIHGCYARSGGSLRVIDATVTNCKAGRRHSIGTSKGSRGHRGHRGRTVRQARRGRRALKGRTGRKDRPGRRGHRGSATAISRVRIRCRSLSSRRSRTSARSRLCRTART